MNKKILLRWILLITLLYCWIKFYAFYQEGSSQGPLPGERLKGGFIFHLELFAYAIPIMLFTCSIFYSCAYLKGKTGRKNGNNLLAAVLLFIPPFGLFQHQIYEPFIPSVVTQTLIYRDADFLWECRILFFIAGLGIIISFSKFMYFSLKKETNLSGLNQ